MHTTDPLNPPETVLLVHKGLMSTDSNDHLDHPHTLALIDAMAAAGYAPLCFGEEHENQMTEFWFVMAKDAADLAQAFVARGGDDSY